MNLYTFVVSFSYMYSCTDFVYVVLVKELLTPFLLHALGIIKPLGVA